MRELKLRRAAKEAERVEGALFPPVPRRRKSDKQQRRRLVVPTAPKKRRLAEPSKSAEVASAGDPDPSGNPDPVVFHHYGPATGDGNKSIKDNAADISGADSEADVVMQSANWYCNVSVDGGTTWKQLDPTAVFPAGLGGGFCCDQIVLYVPRIDRFVWFMQHSKSGSGEGAFRLAAASSQSVKGNATAWTYWDFVAGDFGDATTDMDYPDMAYSSNFLFISTDVFKAGGRLVLRIPLQELAAGGTINFAYTDPAKSKSAWGAHLVQQTQSAGIWLGQPDNSNVEVFTMADAGNTYSSFKVAVATWPNGILKSTGPDGNDWLTKLREFPVNAVTGGVQSRKDRITVAWTASKGDAGTGGFKFPDAHVRVVEIDLATRKAVSEMQIWNPDYAFAYPSLTMNGRNAVGVICGWGGPSNHANCAMGIIGDFVLWYRDGSTRTTQRFGDYVTTRRAERNQALFGGYGYYVTKVSGDTSKAKYNPIYVRYGRQSVGP